MTPNNKLLVPQGRQPVDMSDRVSRSNGSFEVPSDLLKHRTRRDVLIFGAVRLRL